MPNTDILIKDDLPAPSQPKERQELVSWVMGHVAPWRDVRETTYRKRWDEWYHIWRGRWTSESKSRKTERSKVIAPVSQIAVDTAAAELLEALFSRENFVDVGDDVDDQQKEDAILVRDRLVEDLKADGIVETMAEICTLGALYGQFSAKIVTEVETVSRPVRAQREDGTSVVRQVTEEKVRVYPVPIEPGHLIPDPSAVRDDDMLGIIHEFKMPLHKILQKQELGVYFDTPVRKADTPDYSTDRTEESGVGTKLKEADIVEWHGFVPTRLLTAIAADKDGDELMLAIAGAEAEGEEDSDLTDAIVTIANGHTLLRAIPNPSVMQDRALVNEQFDTVPNRFWGRGVMEKGYNMQKSLDSELRARQDGLAWTNNPMFAYDLTKMPPGSNIDSWPGKGWGMKGDPREGLMPLQFGSIDPNTFNQTSELERMLQFATGAVDPSILNGGVRDQANGASAVNVSGIVKRNKRTMLNLEVFVQRLIKGIIWRKMKFDPERYPADYNLVVRGTVGIMSREIEQNFLIQMLQYTGENLTREQAGILRMVVESSSHPDKGKLLAMLEEKMQPPSEEQVQKQQQLQQLQEAQIRAALKESIAKAAKAEAEAERAGAQAIKTRIEAELIDDELQLGAVKARVDVQQAINQERQVAVSEQQVELAKKEFERGQ